MPPLAVAYKLMYRFRRPCDPIAPLETSRCDFCRWPGSWLSPHPLTPSHLDGNRFPLGFEELVNQLPVKDILAIEAYPDMLAVPAQWRTGDACAVVVVWSKR